MGNLPNLEKPKRKIVKCVGRLDQDHQYEVLQEKEGLMKENHEKQTN